MRVWINSVDEGWVQHGQVRSSSERAAIVAKLLATRKGWEALAGPTAPLPRPPREGAPTGREARKSPALFDAPAPPGRPFPSRRLDAGEAPIDAVEEAEPYLQELASFALEAQLRDFLIGRLPRLT